jgi:hypothetical protein
MKIVKYSNKSDIFQIYERFVIIPELLINKISEKF